MSARDDYPIHARMSIRGNTAGVECDRMLDEIDRLRCHLAASEQSRYEWQRRALGNAISSFNEHVARRGDVVE